MIPARLIRTAPDTTTPEQDWLWDIARDLHPDWEHVDLRNSIDPAGFPLTSPYWATCETGAMWADLCRFEELWTRGGIYIDSDVHVVKPFTPLLGLEGVAGWEDDQHICIAVMGFTPNHPAMREVIKLALKRHHLGTWKAGVGAATDVFKTRGDMLLLPPGSYYPWHWKEVEPPDWREKNPWAFCGHRWAKSWLGET